LNLQNLLELYGIYSEFSTWFAFSLSPMCGFIFSMHEYLHIISKSSNYEGKIFESRALRLRPAPVKNVTLLYIFSSMSQMFFSFVHYAENYFDFDTKIQRRIVRNPNFHNGVQQ
jgi:hypothetical protein